MSGFLGKYEYQLDAKGRVSLPAAFRRATDDDSAFVLVQWQAPSLTLFPMDEWARVVERLREFRRSDPDAWNYVRSISSSAVEVRPDKQGRILIPAWLKDAAHLDGSALLIGALDRVEIWNPEIFERTVADETDSYGRFAARIFG